MIIVFEGIDGCGKGTQIRELSKIMRFDAKNYPDRKGVYGELFNNILKDRAGFSVGAESLFAMFLMDMLKDAELLKQYKGNASKTLLIDRYAHSTLAYQCAQGVDYEKGKQMIRKFGLVEPDLVIIMHITPEESMNRIRREKEIFENEGFLSKVSENYARIFDEKFFAEKMYWVDGIKNVEEINREIRGIINK